MFLGYLDVGSVELPIAVRLEDTKDVPDDLLLPVNQLEGFSRPGALGMAEALDEHDGIIRSVRIIVGSFLHEPCRLVVLQFSRCPHLQGIKNSRHRNRCDLPYNEQQPLSEPLL